MSINNSKIQELRKGFEEMLSSGISHYYELDDLEILAQSYEQESSFQMAFQVVAYGLELYPGNQLLLLCKAQYLLMLERVDEAKEVISTVVERSAEYYLLLSEIELVQGNEDASLAALDMLAGLPDCTIDLCIDILDICVDLDRIDFLSRFTHKVEARFDDASPYLRELALVYEEKENYNEAIELYNKILDINPFSTEDWFSLAKVHALCKDYDKAIEACDFALAINENDENVVAFKGYCLYDSERFSEAIEQFETFLQMTSDKAVAYELKAEVYARLEQHENAIEYLLKAIEIDSSNHNLYYQLAVNYYNMGELDNAVKYLREAISYNVTDREARIFLGEILLQKDEYEEAYKQLLYVDKDPITDIASAAAYADVCIQLQRYKEALYVLAQLVEKEPYEPHFVFDFILCYMQLGDYEAAADWVEYVEETSKNSELLETLDATTRQSWISIAKRIEELRNILKVYLDQKS